MLCRNCKQKMNDVMHGSAGTFISGGGLQFCENKDCEEFGYVVMVGYPEESEKVDNQLKHHE